MLQLLAQQQGPGQFTQTVDAIARTPISTIVLVCLVLTAVRLGCFYVLVRRKPHISNGLTKTCNVVNEVLDSLIYAAIVVFLLIRPFVIQTFTIPTGSMLQTLQLGDYIIANKAIYRYSQPQQGDIIVFKPPERALYDFQKGKDIDFVKRLIALPGQVVEIRGGSLYIDGQQVAEPYLSSPNEFDFKLVEVDGEYWPVQYNAAFVNPPRLVADEYVASTQEIQERLRNAPPAAIPDGYFLAMGDNRTGSFDSRGWGLAPLDSIIGRSEVIFWPPRHWKVTR